MNTLARQLKQPRSQSPDAPAAGAARPTLLVFASARSGHSRRTDGFLAQVLQRRGNHETFRVVRVDTDKRPELLARFSIAEIPTLLVLDDGKIRARLSNPRGCLAISELLSPWLK